MGNTQVIFGPKKNTAFNLYLPFFTAGTAGIKTTPTIAAGDVQISNDGGVFTNPATLPAETPAGGGAVLVALSAGEMNADVVVVRGIDQAGSEWDDWAVTIYTKAVTVDELVRSATPANALAVDGAGSVAVAAGGITSSSFAADAVDSNALASTAANKVRDTILDDATRFSGAKVDASVSSRADGAVYTNARATKIDNLDALVSSRADGADYTGPRAAALDNLDALVSSRVSASSLTPTRAANLDRLDVAVSTRAATGDPMTLADGAVDAAKVTAAAGNKIADHAIRRKLANVRASSDGDSLDKRSLLGAASRLANKIDTSSGQLKVYDETDAGTPFATFNLVGDSAATPIKTATPV